MLEIDDEGEKEDEGDEEIKEVRENAHFMHGDMAMTTGWNEAHTQTS